MEWVLYCLEWQKSSPASFVDMSEAGQTKECIDDSILVFEFFYLV